MVNTIIFKIYFRGDLNNTMDFSPSLLSSQYSKYKQVYFPDTFLLSDSFIKKSELNPNNPVNFFSKVDFNKLVLYASKNPHKLKIDSDTKLLQKKIENKEKIIKDLQNKLDLIISNKLKSALNPNNRDEQYIKQLALDEKNIASKLKSIKKELRDDKKNLNNNLLPRDAILDQNNIIQNNMSYLSELFFKEKKPLNWYGRKYYILSKNLKLFTRNFSEEKKTYIVNIDITTLDSRKELTSENIRKVNCDLRKSKINNIWREINNKYLIKSKATQKPKIYKKKTKKKRKKIKKRNRPQYLPLGKNMFYLVNPDDLISNPRKYKGDGFNKKTKKIRNNKKKNNNTKKIK